MSPTHWKLTLAYDGSHFHGWQVQPGLRTVQGVLAEALRTVTGEDVLPQGSGRTDAGVHALAQVASFSLSITIPPENLLRALNRVLPSAVRIHALEPVLPSFHARHSAERKTYEYRIFERRWAKPGHPAGEPIPERICSPFLAPFVWDCRWPLSLDPMNTAAALLCGTHDYTSSAASDPERSDRGPERSDRDPERSDREIERSDPERSDSNLEPRDRNEDDSRSARPNPVKTIHYSSFTREDGLLLYRVTGSGFLHHMVRNFVGTLVDIGRGSFVPADIPRILAARNRTAAGPTAPARGLFLREVEYAAEHTRAQPAAPERP